MQRNRKIQPTMKRGNVNGNKFRNDTDHTISKDIKTAFIIIIHVTIIYMLKKIKEIIGPAGFSIKIDL